MVLPHLCQYFTNSKISLRETGSSMETASSKINISGRKAITPLSAIFWVCPKESAFVDEEALSSMSTMFKDSIVLSSTSDFESPRFCGPNEVSLETIALTSCSFGDWNTIPIVFPFAISIWPDCGTSRPHKSLEIVLFPLPLCPTIAT